MSCKSQKITPEKVNSNSGLTLLVEDGYFPVDNQEAMVITDEKSLRGFFSKVNRTRKPGIPVPNIDFDKELALIVCAGAKQGNQMPYLLKKDEKETSLTLGIENKPFGDDIDEKVTIYPFIVYKMPKTEKDILFEW